MLRARKGQSGCGKLISQVRILLVGPSPRIWVSYRFSPLKIRSGTALMMVMIGHQKRGT